MNIKQKQDMLEACMGDTVQGGLWPPLPFNFQNLGKKRFLSMGELDRFFRYGESLPDYETTIGVVDNLRLRREKLTFNFSRKTMELIQDIWRV